MANEKEIIKKLFEVVAKQQKTIVKMAQAMGVAPPFVGQGDPDPGKLEPSKVEKRPAEVLLAALQEPTKSSVLSIKESGDKLVVAFKEGQKTQKNYDAVKLKLEELTNDNTIQRVYQLAIE